MPAHPYEDLPDSAFWHRSVSDRHVMDLSGIYEPKFQILPHQKIATAGSCFAQHFSKALKQRNCQFVDEEPAPSIMPQKMHAKFNYGLYSARYGNIYSPRQMLQTLERAKGLRNVVELPWLKNDLMLDPFRPMVEPEGYENNAELEEARARHLEAVLRVFETARVFVFTLGLTETWISKADGSVFPMCPGTVGGVFDKTKYAFHNLSAQECIDDMTAFFKLARQIRPNINFLLTVSPVPLTATASGEHVLTATQKSKSILRAACAALYDQYDFVDYFPSYELISAPTSKGFFFEPDMRSVSPAGVKFAMDTFFAAHQLAGEPETSPPDPQDQTDSQDIICDEEILKGFAK